MLERGQDMKEIRICLRPYIDEEGYEEARALKAVCEQHEKMELKVELDYKLSLAKGRKDDASLRADEFFCHADGRLVGYLGIFHMGRHTAELTGMVHPEYRRKGIFTRLYTLALEECRKRKFERILLVCDHASASGLAFIGNTGAAYSVSEYQMAKHGSGEYGDDGGLVLRRSQDADVEEIARQNKVYFGFDSGLEPLPSEEEKIGRVTYIVEKEGTVIGKVRLESHGTAGFLSGFGILPEYRGKGYGRKALIASLNAFREKGVESVGLDVSASNSSALGLYQSCGFVEQSVIDYYAVEAV
jgi:ribosomal protein S18 acetylase RimI-like enzyme